MAKLPTVREYMDTTVQTLNPDMDIVAAVTYLLKNRITGAPVIDDDNHVIGILTEKDCLRLLAIGDEANQRPKGIVREFMTTNVKTVPPNMNIYFAAGMFLNDVIRRFPVVDNETLIGVITRFDILRAIEANLS